MYKWLQRRCILERDTDFYGFYNVYIGNDRKCLLVRKYKDAMRAGVSAYVSKISSCAVIIALALYLDASISLN